VTTARPVAVHTAGASAVPVAKMQRAPFLAPGTTSPVYLAIETTGWRARRRRWSCEPLGRRRVDVASLAAVGTPFLRSRAEQERPGRCPFQRPGQPRQSPQWCCSGSDAPAGHAPQRGSDAVAAIGHSGDWIGMCRTS
jgi:hypothetical protein